MALIGLTSTVLVFRGTGREQEERARTTFATLADWRSGDLSAKLRAMADYGAGTAALFSKGGQV